MLLATSLRADGIALSTDGLIWTKGVGGFGEGWNYSGRGISVRQGETVYVKYYSDQPEASLYFTEHGRKWGEWRSVGPALTPDFGQTILDPVILKISNVGTPNCTIAWVNGRGTSGIWSGLPAPGPYDLALHGEARWTLPPIVVTEAPKPPGFWASLLNWFNTPSPGPSNGVYSVPDNGLTAGLLAFALLSLRALHRRMR